MKPYCFPKLQQGSSLVIMFVIMAVMLTIVLGMSVFVFREAKVVTNITSSLSALQAAWTGVEKTAYYDRKQIPAGGNRGLCNICSSCADCAGCTATPLAPNGCDNATCNNCQVSYTSAFDQRSYTVTASVSPNLLNGTITDFVVASRGSYRSTERTVGYTSSQTTVQAPVTVGPLYPTAGASVTGIGTVPWGNPGNVVSDNSVFATASLANTTPLSRYLVATGFGFSIPTGATINGIMVEWKKNYTTNISNPGAAIVDNAVRLVKGGVVGSTDRSSVTPWTLTSTYRTYGSSNDLWGTTWTPADINASSFGPAIAARYPAFQRASVAQVDTVRVTVTYTPQ